MALHPSQMTGDSSKEDEEASSTKPSDPIRLISEDVARSMLKEAVKVAGNDISLVSLV